VKSKLIYYLKQQTPLLHFQFNQINDFGATLRATEVKPKLDRFLVKRNGIENIKDEWKITSEGDVALNYKMRITALGRPSYNVSLHPLYFGNRGVHSNFKKPLFYEDGVKLEIICFDDDLRRKIDGAIPAFFLITNFGTRQTKGFGSFYPFKSEDDSITSVNSIAFNLPIESIVECIRSAFKGDIYYVEYSEAIYKERNEEFKRTNRPCEKSYDIIMDDIQALYSLLKSGANFRVYYRSFIYLYMHGFLSKYDIANEKAWMKQNGICPVVSRPQNAQRHEHFKFSGNRDYKYVRALLGVGENAEFIKDLNFPKDKMTVKIKCSTMDDEDPKKPAIQRFASPILFKVVGDYLIILPYEPNQAIFSKEFTFTGYETKDPMKIKTPDSFDMKDFMEKFVQYINEDEKIISEKKEWQINLLSQANRIYLRKTGFTKLDIKKG
jgi:hypothetical protein